MDHPEREPVEGRIRPLAESAGMPEEEIDLLDYVEVIVRRRWLVFWGTVICALTSLVYSQLQPVVYRAEASVLPLQDHALEMKGEAVGLVWRTEHYLKSLRSVTIGRSIMERKVLTERARDSISVRTYLGGNNTKVALAGLAACSDFEQDVVGVITVAVTLQDSVVPASLANIYVDELILFYTEKQKSQVSKGVEFIETRFQEVQRELWAAEDSLAVFLETNRTGADVQVHDPRISMHRDRLQGKVNFKRSIYGTLANQYELARIEARKEAPTFEVLSLARPGDVLPIRSRIFWIGGLAGLCVSVLLAFLVEYLTHRSGRIESMLSLLREDVRRLERLIGCR